MRAVDARRCYAEGVTFGLVLFYLAHDIEPAEALAMARETASRPDVVATIDQLVEALLRDLEGADA